MLGRHALKPPFLQYAEAQIWGGFGIPDVKEWWLPEKDPISNAKLEEIKNFGLPIYLYSESPPGEQYYITRGQQIYAGDAEKIAHYRQVILRDSINPDP